MTTVEQRIECRWCHGQSPVEARTCDRCGAPLDIRDTVTDSGWRQAPKLRDLTEFRFGNSVCQIDGTVVPVADVALGEGASVFFEHHAMLWKDETVPMSVMAAPGGMKRIVAGTPFVLSVGHGPGRLSFSRDAPGELVVLPVDPGVEIDVREHAMLLASGTLSYTFERLQGLRAVLASGAGMYLERFLAQQGPGLLVLHGYGNVLQRTLGPGETVQIEPGGFLYKDASVTIDISTQKLVPEGANSGVQAAKGLATRGVAGLKAVSALRKQGLGGLLSGDTLQTAAQAVTGPGLTLMRCTGPGRVGIQSMYQHFETA